MGDGGSYCWEWVAQPVVADALRRLYMWRGVSNVFWRRAGDGGVGGYRVAAAGQAWLAPWRSAFSAFCGGVLAVVAVATASRRPSLSGWRQRRRPEPLSFTAWFIVFQHLLERQ